MQDAEFIRDTVKEMLSGLDTKTMQKIIGSANQYATIKKFPKMIQDYSDAQLDTWFKYIEKLHDMPIDYTQEEFANLDIIKKVESVMGEVEDITPGVKPASAITESVINNMEQQNKYRDDLKCPWCNEMVYDNRNNKKSEKSPDFVCSTNDAIKCSGHSGKWRKSWWLDNSDLPKEWNLDSE